MHEIALLLDTETTGLHEPQVIEVAWIRSADRGSIFASAAYNQRFRPSKPIEFGAMAIHHITDEDLINCPPSDSFRLPDGVQYLIGHNIDYDWDAIGKPDVRRIDTLALSRMLWPEADSHKLTALLYMLDRPFAKEHAPGAHSAVADVFMLRGLLSIILDYLGNPATFEELWRRSEAARVPRTMPRGVHRGELIEDVPADYRRWMLSQPDLDPYLRRALEAVEPPAPSESSGASE